jgi:hypothetical protein
MVCSNTLDCIAKNEPFLGPGSGSGPLDILFSPGVIIVGVVLLLLVVK